MHLWASVPNSLLEVIVKENQIKGTFERFFPILPVSYQLGRRTNLKYISLGLNIVGKIGDTH